MYFINFQIQKHKKKLKKKKEKIIVSKMIENNKIYREINLIFNLIFTYIFINKRVGLYIYIKNKMTI